MNVKKKIHGNFILPTRFICHLVSKLLTCDILPEGDTRGKLIEKVHLLRSMNVLLNVTATYTLEFHFEQEILVEH